MLFTKSIIKQTLKHVLSSDKCACNKTFLTFLFLLHPGYLQVLWRKKKRTVKPCKHVKACTPR